MSGLSTGVTLDAGEVDNLRRLVDKGHIDRVCSIPIAKISLDGAVELACSWWQWQHGAPRVLLSRLDDWSRQHPLLGHAWTAISNGAPEAVERNGSPTVEVRAVPQYPETLASTEWFHFIDRFARSLGTHGRFGRKLALGLSGAFGEMIDNVSQHSSATTETSAPGIVAYQIGPGTMSYAVGDVGRGALVSLRTNPPWSHLRDSAEALDAAIRKSATSRRQQADGCGGSGFHQVHKSLADLNGHLRFRTGDAVLVLDGRGDARRSSQRSSPPLAGFQMSVSCSLSGS